MDQDCHILHQVFCMMTYSYHSNLVRSFHIFGNFFIFLDYQDLIFNLSIHVMFQMGDYNNGYIQHSYMPPLIVHGQEDARIC